VDELLSLPQLAARLRLPRDWLRREALAGRLPCLRIGRKLLFNRSAVKQMLAERAAFGREVSYAK
jgi:excisionase family DNA binding protein